MSSEETPLLTSESTTSHDDVYRRFSPAKKRILVALVSGAGLLPLFVSGSFIPSIPQIAHDLDSTGPIVSLAVSLSILSSSIGNLLWASYSTFYGRRPIYLCGLPLSCIGSLGVGLSSSISQIMAWRFIQAFGVAGGLSVGAGVIGDIYKLEERGAAMGMFFATCLLGLALAPLAGGVAAHYSSWRVMQYALGVCAFLVFISMVFFLPETSHPNSRGIDKLSDEDKEKLRRRKFLWVNPFSSLWLLRSPNLLAVTVAGFTVLLSDYVLLVPLAYTIGVRYGISNEALIGACFLPSGIGNTLGAPLAGRISDRLVIKWRKRRGGEWVPEDRLRATLVGAGVMVPLSVLLSGLFIQYVGGNIGLVLNLVCLFVNGFGVDMVLSPSAAYGVDIMHSRSAETMAANNGSRSLFLAVAVAGILPMINTIGVAWTNTLAALGGWLGFGLLWCTIRYGDRMRAWIDMDYSTASNN